jgi:hypothetical protein
MQSWNMGFTFCYVPETHEWTFSTGGPLRDQTYAAGSVLKQGVIPMFEAGGFEYTNTILEGKIIMSARCYEMDMKNATSI